MAFIGDVIAGCAPAFLLRQGAYMTIKRPRIIQKLPLEVRLGLRAQTLRNDARRAPPGPARDRLLRLALQAETGSQMSEWLRSPGARAPT